MNTSEAHIQQLAWSAEGDTIYSRSEVLEKRESKSRPNVGIVVVKTTGYNQDGKTVIIFKRTVMLYKKGQAPKTRARGTES